MKVLVVDDSRVMRQIVARTMRQAGLVGHDLVEADSGRAGFETFISETPDLVLSEWNLSEMAGLDLLHAVRAGGRAVPFVFVTSESSPEMRARAEQAGATLVLAKPFTVERFRDALAPMLG